MYRFVMKIGEKMTQANKNGNDLNLYIPEQWGDLTIEDLLKDIWHLPKKAVHTLRMEKAIEVNGETVSFSFSVKAGDKLRVRNILKDEQYGYPPSSKQVQILFEDDFLLIVNKPGNMSTHPNTDDDTNTLTNAVVHHLLEKGETCKVQHIHRLDKDTTGTVLFAKSSFVGSILDHMLTERKISRTYHAIVHGKLKNATGTIKEKIGRDRHHATRRRVSPTGQDAVTHYRLLTYNAKKNMSLIACKLDTGRTHQIRVHMSYIGHPLVGDTLYGGKPLFYRQALHGRNLSFVHPLTLETIKVEAPYLDNFLDLVK